jgi:Protein of unknown function (DUF3089)
MKKYILLLSTLITLSACNTMKVAYPQYTPPPAPDYSWEQNWAALPFRQDYADITPDLSLTDQQSSATADVFYIHPTIFSNKKAWNANTSDLKVNHEVEIKAILNQATVFNGVAKIYAPRYRQMTIHGFYTKDTASKRIALQVAYSDIKAAFQYYLKHYNQGRPFIIAAHSQGTVHATWLIRDMIDNTPLQKQMIVAYIPGFPMQQDKFKTIPVCNEPTQTGCITHWATYVEGTSPKDTAWYKDAVVTNPVNWKSDGTPAQSNEHLGIVWQNFKLDQNKKLATSTYKNVLNIQNPIPIKVKKNFHIGDYNLFWLNIRQNAEERVKAYNTQNPITKQ